VTNGSAIRRTFSAPAGAVLTFDWNFLTTELPNDVSFNDFAFVSIVPSSPGSLSTLASTFSSLVTAPSSTGFPRMTGFHTFTFVIPASGDYTLGIGVVNVGDTLGSSAVLVDNVQLSGGDAYALNLGARQVITGRDFGNFFEGTGGDGGNGDLVNQTFVAAAAGSPSDQPGQPSISPAQGPPTPTLSLADAGPESRPLQAVPASTAASGDLVDRAIADEDGIGLADEVHLDDLAFPTRRRLRRWAGSKPTSVLT
jgi:hypothetical protein